MKYSSLSRLIQWSVFMRELWGCSSGSFKYFMANYSGLKWPLCHQFLIINIIAGRTISLLSSSPISLQDTYKTLALLREQEASELEADTDSPRWPYRVPVSTQLAPRAGSSPAREQRGVHTWGADKERPPANPIAAANRQLLETPSGDPHTTSTDVPGNLARRKYLQNPVLPLYQ